MNRLRQIPPTEKRQFLIFMVLCSIGGLAIFSSTISKNPVLPILAQTLGADLQTIGLIAAASTVTGIVTSFWAGSLSDRYGRRPMLILSGIVFFTAPILYLLVHTPLDLALVRVYHGLATAVFGPVAMAYVTDLAPVRRGERLGYFSSFQLAGRSVAPLAGGAILAIGAWQWVYMICAVAGALTLAGMVLLPEPDQRGRKGEEGEPAPVSEIQGGGSAFRTVIGDRTILITSLAEASGFFAFGAIEVFLPLYALSAGIDTVMIGLLFLVQVGVRTLTRPLFGKVSDQRGRKTQITTGLLLTAVTAALFPYTTAWPVLLCLSALFGMGFSVASAATSAFVADLAPSHGRGTALGLMSTIMDIGQAAGPVLMGGLLALFSYRAGFGVTGGVVLVCAFLFQWLAVEER